ncbi:MAG: hypothetical protein AB7F86_11985 [Bdellovibrionales bacterium]
MPVNLELFISDCDQDLRAGRGVEVRSRLLALPVASVPDKFRLPLSILCRRCGEVNTGLRLLTPRVRPARPGLTLPSGPEWAEYAALLNMSGATKEAISILANVDPTHAPQVFLFRAFCHMAHWDYAAARESLGSYLAAPLDDYSRFVGRVNLASALLFSGDPQVREFLGSLIEEAKRLGHLRLMSNLLEMRSQLHLREDRWDEMELDLNAAAEILAQDGLDSFRVTKWQAVLEALKTRDLKPLRELSVAAALRGEYETMREADLYSLKISFDQELFHKIYYGTAAAPYRARIERELGQSPKVGAYVYGDQDGPVVSLRTGQIVNGDKTVAVSRLPLRVLSILTRDLYRPMSTGGLHAELFPGEYFNIYSSPNRVHQTISRARRWLEKNELPATIEVRHSTFSVKVHRGVGIELDSGAAVATDPRLLKLKQAFGLDYFSATEARAKLQLSRSSFQRLASAAAERGLMKRYGHGSAVTYQIVIDDQAA